MKRFVKITYTTKNICLISVDDIFKMMTTAENNSKWRVHFFYRGESSSVEVNTQADALALIERISNEISEDRNIIIKAN